MVQRKLLIVDPRTPTATQPASRLVHTLMIDTDRTRSNMKSLLANKRVAGKLIMRVIVVRNVQVIREQTDRSTQ